MQKKLRFGREQRLVAKAFQTGMSAFQKEPLVLYGIGINTEAVLALSVGYTIVGLLDREESNVGKEFYGKPVLPLEEAAALAKRIVIIARASITPVIFSRIKVFAQEHGITVHDYTGKELGASKEAYDPSRLDEWNRSWSDLKKAIEVHDVISFDVFDTLLGRYVLRPADVFSLVERDLQGSHEGPVPFERLRIQAEQDCGYAAALEDIYSRLQQSGVPQEICREWCARELDWERKVIFPRRKMVEAFCYARSLGKVVFLTSDMYLSKQHIAEMLNRCGIFGYEDLLVSCEEKAEKSDGKLYEKLLKRTGVRERNRILHIGDNRFSDGEMARQMGLDTWRIWSGYDLLSASSFQAFLVKARPGLGIRLAMGLLCAKLFEDPFALHETRGRVVFEQPEQLGYCFLGPWSLGFMQWASEQVRSLGIKQFLYPARDGFLFWRIGQIMQGHGYMEGTDQRYIKASRLAVSTAAISSKEDVMQLVKIRESYLRNRTNGELLQSCFAIEPETSDVETAKPVGSQSEVRSYLEPYLSKILSQAARKRECYLNYLKGLGVCREKTAVFDFVAQGTVQFYLERLLGIKMTGLYCGTLDHPNEMFPASGHVISAFGNTSYYTAENTLLKVYQTLEAVLVDGDEMFLGIGQDGQPVFRSNCEAPANVQALAAQEGACTFVSDYLELFGSESLALGDVDWWLGLLFDPTVCTLADSLLQMFKHDEIPEEEILSAFKSL